MNVSLTPELEAFVHDRVASGRYTSASEVVRESLRLLEDEDRSKEHRLEALKMEISKGLDDLRSGRAITLETEDDYARLAAEIKTEGLRLFEKRTNNGKS
ncbi:MAG TPA: type II toxin-antitoxin system ParD family antitoxin [Pyrinomonadaceae bacterium]|nr:type II toxin-antitoxin system ParD family antitoxin [Pyrinomonadaceae bacterium]